MEKLFMNAPMRWNPPDAEISYWNDFLKQTEADYLFNSLMLETPWRQDPIKIFGKTYPQPRLTALYGNPNLSYGYSGIRMQPMQWTMTLLDIKNKIEMYTPVRFTSVLLNLYRDGKDSNGWHADNEKELGKNPYIASLSLGHTRDFHLKHNYLKEERMKIELHHGSLLLMGGATQHYWKHQIAKTAKPVGPRINLTFREVHPTC